MRVTFNQDISMRKNNYSFAGSNQNSNISSFINTDRMVDSFISIAKVGTGSNEKLAEKGVIPSTAGQKVLANILVTNLKTLGLTDVNIDEHSLVTATLEGNIGENSPVIGLLAHMDTSQDAPNKNVKPKIHDYKGGDLKLTKSAIISADDLKNYIGQKIITSSGSTLLGADDKAGIAEILEAVKVFQEHPELKRPKIKIAFTPDEETGMGIDKFDIKKFGADIAYTIDGDLPQVIENESFNAFNPEIVIKGKNAHCGYAKGKMIDSLEVANWIRNKLPKNQTPRTTEGKQGYFYFEKMNGTAAKTTINMLVRDHDYEKAKGRIAFLQEIIREAQEKFKCVITFNPKERYHNMKEEIDKFPEVLEYAKEGMKRSGLIPKTVAIRGGTDGSNLSLRGLPTPNLGAGGQNFHSKTEFLPISDMVKCTANILNTMIVWAENAKKVMPKILSRR